MFPVLLFKIPKMSWQYTFELYLVIMYNTQQIEDK